MAMANTKAALLRAMRASLPETLRRSLALAADAALYGFVAAMWVNNAANAAAIFSRWACGEGSLVAAAAMKVFNASMLAMGVSIPFAAPHDLGAREVRPITLHQFLAIISPPSHPEIPFFSSISKVWIGGFGGEFFGFSWQSGGGGGVRAEALAVQQQRRRDGHGGGNRPVALLVMYLAGWVLIGGVWLRDFGPEKGSCQYKVGSVLADLGGFVTSVMYCFIFGPNLVSLMMRDSRR
uniref:Uncharacterized protein n=1 Tax=Leersia perrieri TaxID=77586 RepID=A0A0D9X7V2_9ORYZ